MLSRPPFWFARSMSSAAACGQIRSLVVDDRMHDFRIDHVGQAVRTQQVDVVGLDPVFGDVGGNDRLDSQRARDQVLVQRVFGLLGRDLAAVDLLLQQRMVMRQLLELLAAQPVAARIADVADRHPIGEEHGGDDRRAHARALGTRLRRFVDALVGRGDLLLQQQRCVRQAALNVDLRQLAPGLELGQHPIRDDVDGDAARDLAGVVAAHAVGEHGDASRAVDVDGVLVVRAHHAWVRQAGDVERGACPCGGQRKGRLAGPRVQRARRAAIAGDAVGRGRPEDRCRDLGAGSGARDDDQDAPMGDAQCTRRLRLDQRDAGSVTSFAATSRAGHRRR